MIAPTVSNDAVAFTPGGGRLGQLAAGAFDGALADIASRQLTRGRRIAHSVSPVEAPLSGLPEGSTVEFMLVPADQFPSEVWPMLLEQRAVEIAATLDADEVVSLAVEPAADASGPRVQSEGDRVVTVFAPIPRLVIAGGGPFADALAAQGRLLGWKVFVEGRPEMVTGLTASLGALDAVVVMGHDVESSSRCLMAALESEAGYVGALGSAAMQQSRADWLAYREVTDLSRVHGPAGLPLGGRSPAEVAVSIVAEILDERADGARG